MAIEFHYEGSFQLENETDYTDWVSRVLDSEGFTLGEVSYVFCEDEYLAEINLRYLNHRTLTDIITFDYSRGMEISGDIFVSVPRVRENARKYKVHWHEELLRVMAHGVLHLMGYNDKSEEEIATMRNKENQKMDMFHVEQ